MKPGDKLLAQIEKLIAEQSGVKNEEVEKLLNKRILEINTQSHLFQEKFADVFSPLSEGGKQLLMAT